MLVPAKISNRKTVSVWWDEECDSAKLHRNKCLMQYRKARSDKDLKTYLNLKAKKDFQYV